MMIRFRARARHDVGPECGIRCLKREDGVVLIEFALILPILIVLFLGLAEFTEAFSVNRKLAGSAGTVSDLVAQEVSVDDALLADVTTIADELMKPHSTTPLDLVIVSVVADAENNTSVDWSFPATSYAPGEPYALPDTAITTPNSSLIVTEASYNFTPTVGRFLGTFQMNEVAFFRPRRGLRVIKLD